MNNIQKMGGWAALVEALLYIVGFAFFIVLLDASAYEGPERMVEFLIDHKVSLYVVNLLIYVVFGVVLVVLTLALHEHLKHDSPVLTQIATAFGLIWSGLVIASGMIANIGMDTVTRLYLDEPLQASVVWQTLSTVQEALGGGNEIVGGLWVLLISLAALTSSRLSNGLNYLGILIGVAGILTAIPTLEVFTAIFGLGQIVWFVWLGIVLLR